MKAFLIDPLAATVTAVEYSGELDHMYELIQCQLVDRVIFNEAGDTVYVDDEGLLAADPDAAGYFAVRGYPNVLCGRGLVLGANEQGDSIEPQIELDDLRDMITFRP